MQLKPFMLKVHKTKTIHDYKKDNGVKRKTQKNNCAQTCLTDSRCSFIPYSQEHASVKWCYSTEVQVENEDRCGVTQKKCRVSCFSGSMLTVPYTS